VAVAYNFFRIGPGYQNTNRQCAGIVAGVGVRVIAFAMTVPALKQPFWNPKGGSRAGATPSATP
jgi:hypothetical protein